MKKGRLAFGRQKAKKKKTQTKKRKQRKIRLSKQLNNDLQDLERRLVNQISLDFNYSTAHSLPEAVIYLTSEGNQPSIY